MEKSLCHICIGVGTLFGGTEAAINFIKTVTMQGVYVHAGVRKAQNLGLKVNLQTCKHLRMPSR